MCTCVCVCAYMFVFHFQTVCTALHESVLSEPSMAMIGSSGLGLGMLTLRILASSAYGPVSVFTMTMGSTEFCSRHKERAAEVRGFGCHW